MMRLREIGIEIGLIGLVLGVGFVVSIPLQNPPLTGAMLTFSAYVIAWITLSKLKYNVWWAVESDLKETTRQENILTYADDNDN